MEQGDEIRVIEREPHQVRVADLNRLQRGEVVEIDLMHRAVQIDALPEEWRAAIQEGIG